MNKSNFTLAEFLVALFAALFLGIFGAALTFSGLIIRFVTLLVITFIVQWLWNHCLVGAVVVVCPITSFWHAFGLVILCNLLIKGKS